MIRLIRRFLDPDSVGWPQFLAGGLLLVYLLQCAWLIRVETLHGSLPDSNHDLCIYHGLEQFRGGPIAGTPETLRSEMATGIASAGNGGYIRVRDGYDQDRSPLYYLTCAAPYLIKPPALPSESVLGQLWATAPYLFFGVMLGGSIWYVSRRLYGNAGGYVALTLYCFSPATIMAVAGAPNLGEMGRSLGRVWLGLHCHRGRPHALRAPRSCLVERPPHRASSALYGAHCGQPVLAHAAASDIVRADVLGSSSTAARRDCHLVRRGCRGSGLLLASYFFHLGALLAGPGARALD